MTVLDTIKHGKKAARAVDDIPPLARLFPLGLQHVMAMYAGAVAVPLIVGGAMVGAGQMRSDEIVHLITADLFVAGIATIVQAVGFWRFGVRLPLMQGVTFAAVGPMITIGLNHGITAIYGSVIACGLFMMLVAPIVGRLIRFFPPLVTGTIILIIGISLMSVAAGWFGGGTAKGEDFGAPKSIAFGFLTLLIIILLERFGPPAVKRVSILLGLVAGTLISIPFGMTDWSHVGSSSWFAVPEPFYFGFPSFDVSSIIAMIIVALVIMTETTGDIVAVGEIVDEKITPQRLADGMRADGAGTVLGGIFNTFPYTAFAQNVGLVAITNVKSRHVATCAGDPGSGSQDGRDHRGHTPTRARRCGCGAVRHGRRQWRANLDQGEVQQLQHPGRRDLHRRRNAHRGEPVVHQRRQDPRCARPLREVPRLVPNHLPLGNLGGSHLRHRAESGLQLAQHISRSRRLPQHR